MCGAAELRQRDPPRHAGAAQRAGASGAHVRARLIGNSTSIDPRSGTLMAQFVAQNPGDALMPRDYAEATLAIPPDTHGVSIPASALIFRARARSPCSTARSMCICRASISASTLGSGW